LACDRRTDDHVFLPGVAVEEDFERGQQNHEQAGVCRQ
jgi:hypothetical protein